MHGEVKHSSQSSRKALKSSSYHIMLPHGNMKLHRVHMAGRSNATIIFLVALQGIWLKCRLKIHTDINLNNKQMHFTPLQMAEVWNVYSYRENITLFTLQKGSAAVTTQGSAVSYNRFILLTGGRLCSFSKLPSLSQPIQKCSSMNGFVKCFNQEELLLTWYYKPTPIVALTQLNMAVKYYFPFP